jgi:hypothetical protein
MKKRIRVVAGWPKGKNSLNLPTFREAERMADPKPARREGAGSSIGADRPEDKIFRNQFPTHRRHCLNV